MRRIPCEEGLNIGGGRLKAGGERAGVTGQSGLAALMRGNEKVALLQRNARLLQRRKRALQLLQVRQCNSQNVRHFELLLKPRTTGIFMADQISTYWIAMCMQPLFHSNELEHCHCRGQ